MAKKLHFRIPLFSTRATATLSVALVLVILGLAAMVGVAARSLTRQVLENVGFVVVLSDDVTASDIDAVTRRLKKTPGVVGVKFDSAEQILERWQQTVGPDEDIMRLAGVNPFSPELDVRVDMMHSSTDSIEAIAGPVALMPQVADLKINSDIISSVSRTLRSVTLTLVLVAAALLLVSFVLIFNTVRLSVYSSRFIINTMQLVGATPAFVRRPFLVANIVNGIAAGVIASVILGLLYGFVLRIDPGVSRVADWQDAAWVMGGMVATGMLICLAASFMACNRYLNLSYDQLFKQ